MPIYMDGTSFWFYKLASVPKFMSLPAPPTHARTPDLNVSHIILLYENEFQRDKQFCNRRHSMFLLFFRENKTWHFM